MPSNSLLYYNHRKQILDLCQCMTFILLSHRHIILLILQIDYVFNS